MVDRGLANEGGFMSVTGHVELTGGLDQGEYGATGYTFAGRRASAGPTRISNRESHHRVQRKGTKRSTSPLSDGSTQQERYAIKRHLANAEQEATLLMRFAAAEDAISLALSAQQLKGHLRELWRHRKAREDEWAEVVNILQGAFSQVTAELMSTTQAKAIHSVIRDHLAMGYVDNTQPKRVRAMLVSTDLDPWAALQLRGDKDDDEGR